MNRHGTPAFRAQRWIWSLAPALLLAACGGQIGTNPSVDLRVPYRAQALNSFDCGPASVLMWRLHDGLSEISQSTIAAYMGGTSCGAATSAIVAAVNNFTLTHDAFRDLTGYNDYRAFFSRQITSIDNREPVIAIIRGGLHAGVVNGGKWRDLGGGSYQWEYVYFHDPLTRANDYYTGGSWQDTNCPEPSTCEQVISSSASGAWYNNLNSYGDDVALGGGGGGYTGPEHQYAN